MNYTSKKHTFRIILALMFSITMMLGMSIITFAAPKQMPDGTIFDGEFYAQKYPDVVAALGTDENALYQHYLMAGKAEGRLPYAGATAAAAQQAQTVIYDPYASYSFKNPVLAAARANWIGKKTLTNSRVSAIDNIPALFENGNWRTWLEYTSSRATLPRGGASASDQHSWEGTTKTPLDYNTMFGITYNKFSNAFDLMMGEFAAAGINPNFDSYTMGMTKINDWTNRYEFITHENMPAYAKVIAKAPDLAAVTDQYVRLTVDYDTRYGTYCFSFMDVFVRYKTANCPSRFEYDREVYTSYSMGAK